MSFHNYVYVGPYAELTLNARFDPYEILGDDMREPLREDRGWEARTIRMVPNRDHPYTFDLGHEKYGVTPITPEQVARGLEQFLTDYREAIDRLSEQAQVDQVQILWGAISYYS